MKVVAVLGLMVIALALIIAMAVIIGRAQKDVSGKRKNDALLQNLFKIIRIIVTALAFVIGGAFVVTGLSSCSAKRSITLQGTIVRPANSDSTRIIISSQESYTGVRKR